MIPIPFCGPAYESDSLAISAQTCINMYPEINGSDSKVVTSLKPTPGLKLFATLTGGGAMRGIYTASNDRFFGVCGNTLSEITSDGTITVRGTINSLSGIVRMSDNGSVLIVVDGSTGDGWYFTFATNTLTQITDVDYPGGSHVVFLNQRFIVNKPNTQQFYWSDLVATDAADSWDGTNVASAEGSPDNINALAVLGSELWAFGPQSYAVFYDTGVTFARIEGTHSDIGCAAPDSIARSDKNVFWLGGDDNGQGKIFLNNGYQPMRVSNHAIEQTIQRYSKLDDAIGYCYQQLGHDFYVLNFPTASTTWVFDMSTGMWHERNYTDSSDNQLMHRGIVQDFFANQNYVGDWLSSNIYELDPDTYTDNGDAIHRERATPHIWNNLERAYYKSLQIDMEVGVGLTGSGQGSNPQVMLQLSNDGANTWGNEHFLSVGKLGEYKQRVKRNRLGAARDRVFRIRMTDPVKWVILGGYIELG